MGIISLQKIPFMFRGSFDLKDGKVVALPPYVSILGRPRDDLGDKVDNVWVLVSPSRDGEVSQEGGLGFFFDEDQVGQLCVTRKLTSRYQAEINLL